jgi:hypothetical protein
MNFLALHRLAAQRGDGLRPELVRLLERWVAQSDRASPAQLESGDRSMVQSLPDLCRRDTDTLPLREREVS